jgi:Type II secretion system (T2SS), protein E, N-terminal domain
MGLFARRPVVTTRPRPAAHRAVNAQRSVRRAPIQPSAESPSARRFGELLVAESVITQHQLDAALRLQTVARAYVPIGQVLLANKLITRKKLNALLHRYGKRSRLGAILVKAGRITVAQLEEALAHRRHMPLGQALITLGYLDEIAMRDALCTQLHVNFFDLDKIAIDQKLASMISERFAVRHLIVPLFCVREVLVVAVDDPSQAAVIEGLEGHLGLQIEIVTTTTARLMAAMKRLYGPPIPPDVDLFARRNILLGPIRDFVVAELAARALKGVSVVPF